VVSTGNNGITFTKVLKQANGNTLSAYYDSSTMKMIYSAHVKLNTYLAIGFNSTGMTEVDMISWEAGNSTAFS